MSDHMVWFKFLVILFKDCGNTCELKSIVKIYIVVFK